MLSNASEDFYGVGSGEIIYTPPTEKQQKTAQIISQKLGISLPKVFSAYEYSAYISQHISESKKKSRKRRRHLRRTEQADIRRSEILAQREADWEALHLNGNVYAQRILDEKSLPPSWSNFQSVGEAQNRLRALGYKSSIEQKLEKLQEEIEE